MSPVKLARWCLREQNQKYGPTLVEVPESEWPESATCLERKPLRVWRSHAFCVHLWQEGQVQRLTMHRAEIDGAGNWKDGITWNQLQRLKSEAGFGDVQAVEIYPPDLDVIDLANMRHLWLLTKPLPFAWKWSD